ncbi:MAG: nuclease domain-containing protein [Notoacmeibacter sp.]
MGDLAGRPGLGLKQPKAFKPTRKAIPPRSKRRDNETHPLRENARGKACTLRLLGCRNDPAYTVLAHYRRFGWAGMAQKPHDLLGCFACDLCHAKQEAHHPDADLLRAMGETIMAQLRDGLIIIAGPVAENA